MANKLQHEIKQGRPFSSLEQEAALNIQRTADDLQRTFAKLIKPFGITPTQYNVLRILRGAAQTGLRCAEISERQISREPDITRLIDRLQRLKLVRRKRDPQDRRVVHNYITEAGLEKLAALDPLIGPAIKDQLGHMGDERLSLLIDLLEEARANPSDS
ncbi:MAG: MarR family transcriptional regulator [Acidobacteria bacterium]|nr:MarR family transcriptional regulator [Acidobacteriota bacterium]MBW4044027.1 MarR family transcriptional regulator [Acidobacteriota bacterium]